MKQPEIERKWLCSFIPDLAWDDVLSIRQGYFSNGNYELRLRHIKSSENENYILSRKTGIGLVRMENEVPVSFQVFQMLWPLAEKRTIEKTRYIHCYDDIKFEFDEYRNFTPQFFTLEVELEYPEQLVVFPEKILECIIKEVTGDVKYLNSTLAGN
ncbi:MAG: hypothetical protein JXR95_11140 [Deltaproteobacteria bacterium]|nr:hypothetical protein [Deltaproteobacteria bacterium]